MSKTEQALVLDPPTELLFKGPFTEIVTASLKLENPTLKKIYFKVKTTAPKRYCVRPNSGVLDPGASISVAVMLQPFEFDPSEKSKHKFMVQSMFAPDGKVESQEQMWKDAAPEDLMDTKLKCVFDLPEGSQAPVQEVMQEEKAKVVKSEAVSVSPPKTSALSDDKKMMEEARRLYAEVMALRTENSELKDEGARLRKVALADTISSTPSSSQQSSTATATTSASLFPQIIFIIAAVIVGIVIGKLVL